ncbi:alpha/beta hydrolase [Limnohabitans sp.]|uniref:alpha/beta hydrolase n=1 Tax=Limnohabitans sp. TaxID=1907725 RepID=UPI0038B7D6AE
MNSKRNLLLAMGTGLVTSAFTQPSSQTPSKNKGPLVWLDMDQEQLDASYDQSVYAPNIRQVQSRYASNSDITRNRLGNPKRFAYGPTQIEGLDVYLCNRPKAPVNIFIHGGAWRSGLAKNFGFKAETFVNAGAHFVVPDFINAFESGGELMPMIEQVRRSVAWVYKNISSINGDPNRIYISGHSSGAHLAGVTLVTNWQKEYGLPMNIIKGGLLCSGMYDLKPVRLSARSSYVKFTDSLEHALSTQRHLEFLNAPIIVAHGSLETPEFQRQSRDFAKAVKDMGKPVEYVVGQNYNHFEMPETIANPYGILGKLALEQMKIS